MKINGIKHVRRNRNKYAYILIAPGVILLTLIMIYPLIRGVLSSFFTQQPTSVAFAILPGFSITKSCYPMIYLNGRLSTRRFIRLW